ncbi:MAG: hypothetical protein M1836_001113 [Candelina mexicana]|nr:MAG: hypothetical protein M1836_001113 [Candelina mexicana]
MPPKLAIHPRAQEMLKQIRIQELLKEAIDSGLIIESSNSPGQESEDEDFERTVLAESNSNEAGDYAGGLGNVNGPASMKKGPWIAPSFGLCEMSTDPMSQESQNIDLSAHKVAVGLRYIELIIGIQQLRFKMFADKVIEDRFRINFDTMGNVHTHKSGATWFQIRPNDPDFQTGYFSTLEDHSVLEGRRAKSRTITFDRPYSQAPKVVVWLCGVDAPTYSQFNYWLKAVVSDITCTDFILSVVTSKHNIAFSANVCWIAHSNGSSLVTSGTFETVDNSAVERSVTSRGVVTFPEAYDQPPRIVAAINCIDFTTGSEYRPDRVQFKLCTEVTKTGLAWHLDNGELSWVCGAGGAYIAISRVSQQLPSI